MYLANSLHTVILSSAELWSASCFKDWAERDRAKLVAAAAAEAEDE